MAFGRGGQERERGETRQIRPEEEEEESLTVMPLAGEEETNDGRRDRNGGIA
jgi:hypothetical protein